jgi:integrase
MPRVALTDRFCHSAKPLGARTDYFDATVPGLALRVTEGGHRSWSFLFTSPRDGKRARATIGTFPATSLAAARTRALEARGHVEEGRDPRLVLAGQATAEMTVAGLLEAYLADPEKAALRSRREIERRLRRNVLPIVGDVKITELRRRDARNVTDPIIKRGCKVEATRVFEDLRALTRWAVENEYLELNPLSGMSKPAEASVRNRVLSDPEIATLWHGLPQAMPRSTQCQHIIKLCLVTAQRVGEVAGIVASEIDLNAREWRLPAARTKNGFPHVVPLSDLAIEIIAAAITDQACASAASKTVPTWNRLFPCGEGSLSAAVVARAILRAHETTKERPLGRFGIAPWSAHDLRRTALWDGSPRRGADRAGPCRKPSNDYPWRRHTSALFAVQLRPRKACSARSLGGTRPSHHRDEHVGRGGASRHP